MPRGLLFDFMLFFVFFVLYSHDDDSISRKELNGHHTFEFMSLLGAFIFLLKQHIP